MTKPGEQFSWTRSSRESSPRGCPPLTRFTWTPHHHVILIDMAGQRLADCLGRPTLSALGLESICGVDVEVCRPSLHSDVASVSAVARFKPFACLTNGLIDALSGLPVWSHQEVQGMSKKHSTSEYESESTSGGSTAAQPELKQYIYHVKGLSGEVVKVEEVDDKTGERRAFPDVTHVRLPRQRVHWRGGQG